MMKTRIGILLAILVVEIALVLGGCASVAAASVRVMRDDAGNHVRLTDAPCVSVRGVFEGMPKAARDSAKAASVYWQGKNYEACWTEYDDEHEYVIDETGDAGVIPKRRFKTELET